MLSGPPSRRRAPGQPGNDRDVRAIRHRQAPAGPPDLGGHAFPRAGPERHLHRRRPGRPGAGGQHELLRDVETLLAQLGHQCGSQAHRPHACGAGPGHAAARRCRGADAAPAACPVRRRRPGLSVTASLRPASHGPRRDHGLLCGHAAHHGLHELPRAAADRRPGHGFSVPEQPWLLDERLRRRAGDALAVCRRVFQGRVARLSAVVGHRVQPGRGGRLLLMGAADRRGGDHALGDQPHRHPREDALPRHGPDEDAALHLERSVRQRANHRHLPGVHGRAVPAGAGPLRRYPFLHERSGRQRHDLREPHPGLGPSRGLRADAARVRHLL